jgi:hypothetical protein
LLGAYIYLGDSTDKFVSLNASVVALSQHKLFALFSMSTLLPADCSFIFCQNAAMRGDIDAYKAVVLVHKMGMNYFKN